MTVAPIFDVTLAELIKLLTCAVVRMLPIDTSPRAVDVPPTGTKVDRVTVDPKDFPPVTTTSTEESVE